MQQLHELHDLAEDVRGVDALVTARAGAAVPQRPPVLAELRVPTLLGGGVVVALGHGG